MKLTADTDHALRTQRLAALKAPDLGRIEDVLDIPRLKRSISVRAVHELARTGYAVPQWARGDGFRRVRVAADIRAGVMVRLTEGDLDRVECVDPKTNRRPRTDVCRVSRAVREAAKAFVAGLDDPTLARIAAKRDASQRIDPAPSSMGKAAR